MAERKVLNKYFPPDFDPSKIPRRKQAADKQQVIRLMAPCSMRCKSCGEYIYKGRKFNARKETVIGETYFGIKIFRFYIKCTRCSAEITFKTDPKHTDYIVEHGATRNFEPWREEPDEEEDPLARFAEEERRRELEESGKDASSSRLDENGDPMASLEARQAEAKREMDVLDALQDIRTRNAKMDRVDAGDVLERLEAKRKQTVIDPEAEERRLAEEEDEKLVRRYFSRAEDLGGEEEARELREALQGGGAEADDDAQASEATNSPRTPRDGDALPSSSDTSSKPRSSIVVKRAYPLDDEDSANGAHTGEDDSREPDATSLLSERAKSLLSSGATSALPAKKKKKGGPNAFGLVKKKA